MAGIYIHIPFCKQACHYCNFHFSTSLQLKNDFLEALLKEMELQKDYLEDKKIETVYFGGGTPSILSAKELNLILSEINKLWNMSHNVEITLESNPDDINNDKLIAWKNAGINRLSIGVQSFFDEDLYWMNRVHAAQQSIDSVKLSQHAGFNNLTIDLIYGTPTLTDDKWKENIDTAIKLKIPHLSCYALTVETKTALESMINKKKVAPINPEDQARQFLLLMDWMEAAGYEHYEISNFALPGKRSHHNSAYWQGKHYLGLGPSAHSYNGTSRQWNVANNAFYIQSLTQNILSFEKEELTYSQKLNEYIMTSLRTVEGINLDYVVNQFSEKVTQAIEQRSIRFIDQHLLEKRGCYIFLTKKGKLFADGIAADFFI